MRTEDIDIYYVIEVIDDNIEHLNDDDLSDMAKCIIKAIYEEEEIEKTASYVVNHLAQKCKNAGLRADKGFNVEINDTLYNKYHNLLLSVIEGAGDLTYSIDPNIFDYWGLSKSLLSQSNSNIITIGKSGSKPQQETEREKKYFAKAIEAGLMEKTDGGYRWLHNNGLKASLGYFLNRVLDPRGTAQIPYQRMESLFNVSRLDSVIDKALTAKKPQKWRIEIDALFND